MTAKPRPVRRAVAAASAGSATKFFEFFLYGLLAGFQFADCIRRRPPRSTIGHRTSPPPGSSTWPKYQP